MTGDSLSQIIPVDTVADVETAFEEYFSALFGAVTPVDPSLIDFTSTASEVITAARSVANRALRLLKHTLSVTSLEYEEEVRLLETICAPVNDAVVQQSYNVRIFEKCLFNLRRLRGLALDHVRAEKHSSTTLKRLPSYIAEMQSVVGWGDVMTKLDSLVKKIAEYKEMALKNVLIATMDDRMKGEALSCPCESVF